MSAVPTTPYQQYLNRQNERALEGGVATQIAPATGGFGLARPRPDAAQPQTGAAQPAPQISPVRARYLAAVQNLTAMDQLAQLSRETQHQVEAQRQPPEPEVDPLVQLQQAITDRTKELLSDPEALKIERAIVRHNSPGSNPDRIPDEVFARAIAERELTGQGFAQAPDPSNSPGGLLTGIRSGSAGLLPPVGRLGEIRQREGDRAVDRTRFSTKVGEVIPQLVPSALVLVTGGATLPVALAPVLSNSAKQKFDEVIEEGGSEAQATASAVGSASLELAAESLGLKFIGKVVKKAGGKIGAAIARGDRKGAGELIGATIGAAAASAGIEGTEETATLAGTLVFDAILGLKGDPLSEEAWGRVVEQFVAEAPETFALGAIGGSILTAPALASRQGREAIRGQFETTREQIASERASAAQAEAAQAENQGAEVSQPTPESTRSGDGGGVIQDEPQGLAIETDRPVPVERGTIQRGASDAEGQGLRGREAVQDEQAEDTSTATQAQERTGQEAGTEAVGAAQDQPIKVGDRVQWTSQGAAQFETPRRVTAVSDDGSFAFVEGTSTGIPTSQLDLIESRSTDAQQASERLAAVEQLQARAEADADAMGTQAPELREVEPRPGVEQDIADYGAKRGIQVQFVDTDTDLKHPAVLLGNTVAISRRATTQQKLWARAMHEFVHGVQNRDPEFWSGLRESIRQIDPERLARAEATYQQRVEQVGRNLTEQEIRAEGVSVVAEELVEYLTTADAAALTRLANHNPSLTERLGQFVADLLRRMGIQVQATRLERALAEQKPAQIALRLRQGLNKLERLSPQHAVNLDAAPFAAESVRNDAGVDLTVSPDIIVRPSRSDAARIMRADRTRHQIESEASEARALYNERGELVAWPAFDATHPSASERHAFEQDLPRISIQWRPEEFVPFDASVSIRKGSPTDWAKIANDPQLHPFTSGRRTVYEVWDLVETEGESFLQRIFKGSRDQLVEFATNPARFAAEQGDQRPATSDQRATSQDPALVRELTEQRLAQEPGEQTIGRPELANPALDPEARGLVDAVDQERLERGRPERVPRAVAFQAGREELARDYNGTKRRIEDKIARGEGLSLQETAAAAQITSDLATTAMQSGDEKVMLDAMRFSESYRTARADQARMLGLIRDSMASPEQRFQAFVAQALTEPSRQARIRIDNLRDRLGRENDAQKAEGIREKIETIMRSEAGKADKIRENLRRYGIEPSSITDETFADRATAARIARAIATARSDVVDMALEYWINSILSSPLTQSRNIFGNAVYGAWESLGQRTIRAALNVIQRDPNAPSFGELWPMLASVNAAMARAAQNAVIGFKTEAPVMADDIRRAGGETTGSTSTKLELGQVRAAIGSPVLGADTPEFRRRVRSRAKGRGALARAGAELDIIATNPVKRGASGAAIGAAVGAGLAGPVGAAVGGVTGGFLGAGGGRAIRIPGRALVAMDEFFKGLWGHMEAVAQAHRIAKSEGLSDQAMSDRMRELVGDMGSPAWEAALREAERMAFQAEPGDFTRKLISARGRWRALQFVIPFVNTPVNIAKEGFKKTPLASVQLLYGLTRGGLVKLRPGSSTYEYTATQANIDAANAIVGWALALAAAAMMDDDEPWITGSTPLQPGERSQAFRSAPPLSFRVPGTDKWLSYNGIEPMATSLALMIDGVDAMKQAGDDAGFLTAASNVTRSMARQVNDKTFLRGLSDVYEAAFETSGDPEVRMARYAENFATSWVPNVLRHGQRSLDPSLRDMRLRRQQGGKLLAEFGAGVRERTFQSVNRPPIRHDLWGREISQRNIESSPAADFLYRMFVPTQLRTVDRTGPEAQLDRLIRNWNNGPEAIELGERFFSPPSPTSRRKVDGKMETLRFTDEEYARYTRESGQSATESLRILLEDGRLDPENPTVAMMDVIRDTLRKHRKRVANQILQDRVNRTGSVLEP